MTNEEKLEKLKQEREDLRSKRFEIACSDDFAYTNGKMSAINHEIWLIDKQIEELQNAKS